MFEKVKEIIVEQLSVDGENITEDTNLMEDLGIDSLDLYEMIISLEEEFNIEIASEDSENLKTIKDVINYIEARQ